MKIIHVATELQTESSGMTHTILGLCRALATDGHTVTLATLEGPDNDEPFPIRTHPRSVIGKRYGRSPWLKHTLLRSDLDLDLIHSHGLWRMPNIYPRQSAKTRAVPLVVSPHGTLSEEALVFSRWGKAFAWHLVQRRALRSAGLIHATSTAEAEDVRKAGLRNPIAIIPFGICIPQDSAPLESNKPFRTVLAVGRLHRLKAIELTIRSFGRISGHYPEWQLRIVGPPEDPSYAKELRRLASRYDRVVLAGPKSRRELHHEYLDADLFVTTSRSENFGLTVAEALAYGVPVLATRGTSWSAVETKRCGWWTQPSLEEVSMAMSKAMSLSPMKRRELGAAGREWMRQDFSWISVAEKMAAAYEWLLGGDSRDFIYG